MIHYFISISARVFIDLAIQNSIVNKDKATTAIEQSIIDAEVRSKRNDGICGLDVSKP